MKAVEICNMSKVIKGKTILSHINLSLESGIDNRRSLLHPGFDIGHLQREHRAERKNHYDCRNGRNR